MIAILIPTYRRVAKLPQVVHNALQATYAGHVYLLMEPDEATDIPGATTLTRPEGFGTYAAAINHGYRNTTEPWLFTGADDLHFHPGWSEHCLAAGDQVIGTNDLGNPEVTTGTHATHYLVNRRYLDRIGGVFDEGPGSFMPECYDHNWTDREFIETATHRGAFTPCLQAIVEHLHPAWGKSQMDGTYEKSFANEPADAEIYRQRMARMRATS